MNDDELKDRAYRIEKDRQFMRGFVTGLGIAAIIAALIWGVVGSFTHH